MYWRKDCAKKKKIFKKMNLIPKSYDKVKELINNELNNCFQAIVSGSSKNEVETIIDKNFGKDKFNVIINGDDFEGRDKPDPPAPFKSAINKLNIKYSSNHIIIVENAPLGIMTANAANIPSIVILNNSPLDALDFTGLISKDKLFMENRISEAPKKAKRTDAMGLVVRRRPQISRSTRPQQACPKRKSLGIFAEISLQLSNSPAVEKFNGYIPALVLILQSITTTNGNEQGNISASSSN